jgi:hypothetical protein
LKGGASHVEVDQEVAVHFLVRGGKIIRFRGFRVGGSPRSRRARDAHASLQASSVFLSGFLCAEPPGGPFCVELNISTLTLRLWLLAAAGHLGTVGELRGVLPPVKGAVTPNGVAVH